MNNPNPGQAGLLISSFLGGAALAAVALFLVSDADARQVAGQKALESAETATQAFVNGVCLGKESCEGRVLVTGTQSPGEYRLTMGGVYDYDGDKALLPDLCFKKGAEIGTSCEFMQDQPATPTEIHPTT